MRDKTGVKPSHDSATQHFLCSVKELSAQEKKELKSRISETISHESNKKPHHRRGCQNEDFH